MSPRSTALMLAGLLALGCVEKTNPLMPPYGSTASSGVAAGGIDSGAAPPDGWSPVNGGDARADIATFDALNRICDLLQQLKPGSQVCPPPYACYPRDGVGRCLRHLEMGAGGYCPPGLLTDPSWAPCDKNFTCRQLPGSGKEPIMQCMALCQVGNVTGQCGISGVCTQIQDAPDGVGYCQQS